MTVGTDSFATGRGPYDIVINRGADLDSVRAAYSCPNKD